MSAATLIWSMPIHSPYALPLSYCMTTLRFNQYCHSLIALVICNCNTAMTHVLQHTHTQVLTKVIVRPN